MEIPQVIIIWGVITCKIIFGGIPGTVLKNPPTTRRMISFEEKNAEEYLGLKKLLFNLSL